MLILASSSPRRKELLTNLGYKFDTIVSNVDESKVKTPLIRKNRCLKLARLKALDIYKDHKDDIVIGSDTIVILHNKIYEKPIDEKDAYYMLNKLSNKTHKVATAVAIIKDDIMYSFIDIAKVTFKKLSFKDINDYIKTKEPMDKAGAYGYQGLGNKLISKVKGDETTVIGLPTIKLDKLLKEIQK